MNAILIVGHSDTEKVYQQHHIPCKIETTLYARRKKYGSGDVTLLTNPGSICLRHSQFPQCNHQPVLILFFRWNSDISVNLCDCQHFLLSTIVNRMPSMFRRGLIWRLTLATECISWFRPFVDRKLGCDGIITRSAAAQPQMGKKIDPSISRRVHCPNLISHIAI